MRKSVTLKTATRIGNTLKVNFIKINPNQFRKGMEVELEHTDVTKGDLTATGKIAHAHLKEDARYYVKLAKIEGH